MNGFSRFFGHLSTITRHRHKVIAHCAKAGILYQGLFHDLSKYGPTELIQGVRYYSGKHSPTEDERRANGCSLAWMHHKGRNRHHWEYWTDFSTTEKRYAPVPMPKRFLAEMLCDRVAASKIYKGRAYTDRAPLEYLLGGRDLMHPETRETLVHFLTLLAEEGEDAMFSAIRRWLKEKE